MNQPGGWDATTDRNAFLRFIDTSLRGVGQVIFQNNPITGLFFLAAIIWGSVRAGAWEVGVGAIVSVVIATALALSLNVDKASLRQGLFGFNSVLVGCAVPTLLVNSPAMWLIMVIGAAVATIVTLAVANVMKTWDAPTLTGPFVITTWCLLLAAYSFGHLTIGSMGPPKLPQPTADFAGQSQITPWWLLEATLKGPAQVFLINDALSGVLVIVGLAVASRWAALLAFVGSAVAVALALGLGADPEAISNGLYGFSPVLTAVGVGCVFYQISWRIAALALLATVFTVIVQGAMDAAVGPIGIPTLTGPFVFATWIFLLPKAQLRPQPHERVDDDRLLARPTSRDATSGA